MNKHQYTCQTCGTTVYRNTHHGPAPCPNCHTIVNPVVVKSGHGGRPPKYGENMVQISAHVKAEQSTWLNEQPGGLSETLRQLIDQAMK